MTKASKAIDPHAEIRVPAIPSKSTLDEMARRFDPAFDQAQISRDGMTIGYDEADRRQLLVRMQKVYRAATGQLEPREEQPPVAEVKPSSWVRNDWMRALPAQGLEALLTGFMDVDPRHWRPAADYPAGQGFPVVMHNENIGPLLAERTDDDGKHGFFPYVAGLEEDGYRWPIQDRNLDRWKLSPLPATARGWIELFRSEDSPQLAEPHRRDVAEALTAIAMAVAEGKADQVVVEIERFYALLNSRRV